MIRVVGEEKCW